MRMTLLVLVFLTHLGPTTAIAQSFFSSFWKKLDAHELGTWNHIESFERDSVRAIKNMIAVNRVIVMRNNANLPITPTTSAIFNQSICKVIQSINGFYKSVGSSEGGGLIFPSSLQWRRKFILELKDFSQRLRGYRRCDEIPQKTISDMYSLAYRYNSRRQQYIKIVEGRTSNYREQKWSTTLSVEVPGMPFKFEIINGELKFKLSRSIGGLKLDGQFGPIHRRNGSLTLTVIGEGKKNIYEITGKPITFELPSSTITVGNDFVTVIY